MAELVKSFDNCPYHCNNGVILDTSIRKLIPCPHCSEKRKALANEGLAEIENGDLVSLPTILGINNQYLKTKFVYDSIIPEGERLFIEEDSLKFQSDVCNDIYLGLTVGELPSRSYCIGLGYKGMVDRFAYPLLAKAYLSGLTVSRFISCSEYNRMCVSMNSDVDQFYNKDLVLMMIPDGASKADISCAKGLMQIRALNGKPTIFVTTWQIEACSLLLGYPKDESYFLATGVFVQYKVNRNKPKSKYINQLTGVENEVFNGEQPKHGTNMVSLSDLINN